MRSLSAVAHRFSILSAVTVLAFGGCMLTDDAADELSEAVVCPKCETVWVRHGHFHPKKTRIYHMSPEMSCPTCDKMAEAYLEDGKLVLHNCPDCKVTPKVAKPKDSPSHLGHKHN